MIRHSVREATLEDLDFILSELKNFDEVHREKHSFYGGEEYIREGVTRLITNHVAYVSEFGDEKTGFIVGQITRNMYNPRISVLKELWWWVKPTYRHTRAGSLLLKEFTSWGKSHVDRVVMSLTSATKIKFQSLEKLGYKLRYYEFNLEI